MIPISCAIYRVKCMYCRVTVGHIIVDQETSIEGTVNRACATFDYDIIHNNSCSYERDTHKMIASKAKPFVVELI